MCHVVGKLPLGGLLRNNIAKITDYSDLTLVVGCGLDALTQTNKQASKMSLTEKDIELAPYRPCTGYVPRER